MSVIDTISKKFTPDLIPTATRLTTEFPPRLGRVAEPDAAACGCVTCGASMTSVRLRSEQPGINRPITTDVTVRDELPSEWRRAMTGAVFCSGNRVGGRGGKAGLHERLSPETDPENLLAS